MSEPEHEPDGDAQPNWRRLYAAVLITLAVEVVLFYVFTRAFA